MDKISALLAEAKPLYRRKQNEKRAIIGSLFSLCLFLGIWFYQPQTIHFDEDGFDSYFTALYMSDDTTIDDFGQNEVIPLDAYGLFEV